MTDIEKQKLAVSVDSYLDVHDELANVRKELKAARDTNLMLHGQLQQSRETVARQAEELDLLRAFPEIVGAHLSCQDLEHDYDKEMDVALSDYEEWRAKQGEKG